MKAPRSFTKWRDVSGPDRCVLLLKLAELLTKNQQYLAEVESLDNSKPDSIARDIDIRLAIKHQSILLAGQINCLRGKPLTLRTYQR